jgi:hypothetical protein
MDNRLKKCQQCGEYRQLEEFRKYYNKTQKSKKSHYKTCKICESINQRYKYLGRKKELNESEIVERTNIDDMYDILRDAGLQPPTKKSDPNTVPNLVADIVSKRKADLERREDADVELDTPDELVEWLTTELSPRTPEELEEVSDRLWRTYRPKVGVDEADNYKPMYDDTYRDILNQIQTRFDEYEDEFYKI